MKKRLVCIIFITAAIACGKSNSSVLSINDMKTVMWDMFNADSWYAQTAMRDTTGKLKKKNIEFYQQIFLQQNISKEQFYKSYSYYETHTEQMKTLLDSIEAYGTRTKIALDNVPAKQMPHK